MTSAEIYQFPRSEGVEAQEAPPLGDKMKDGYVRTPNPVADALMKSPLTSREARVFQAVQKATYGWQRESAWVAASVLSKMTDLPEGHCSEALNSLIRKNVLIREGSSRSPVRINTDVSQWDFSDRKGRVTPKQKPKSKWGNLPQNGVTQSPQDGVANKDSKDKLLPKGSNETSKKSPARKWGDEIDHELVAEMVAAVSADLDAPIKHNPTTWANEFRLMRERDGRTVEQIRYLINWTAKHQFWSGVVLSPAKLRAKWDQLAKQVKQQARPKQRDDRKGFAQPKPVGTYEESDDTDVPAWMEDLS